MYMDTVGWLLFNGWRGRMDVLMPALKTAGAAREAALVAYIAPKAITEK
jgi:hypothetical protein